MALIIYLKDSPQLYLITWFLLQLSITNMKWDIALGINGYKREKAYGNDTKMAISKRAKSKKKLMAFLNSLTSCLNTEKIFFFK